MCSGGQQRIFSTVLCRSNHIHLRHTNSIAFDPLIHMFFVIRERKYKLENTSQEASLFIRNAGVIQIQIQNDVTTILPASRGFSKTLGRYWTEEIITPAEGSCPTQLAGLLNQ